MSKKKNSGGITAKKVFILFIVLVIIAALVLCGLQIFGKGNLKPSNWGNYGQDQGEIEDDERGNDEELGNEIISVQTVHSTNLMSLASASYAGETDFESAVSKTLTVEVNTPIENPQIDWSLEREDGEEVTELTITPESDGAMTATLTCIEPFEGTILVKATLRGIGVYSYAYVTFEGVPSEIFTSSEDMTFANGMYEVSSVGEFGIQIDISNIFGKVGEKYKDFEIVSVEKFGSFNVQDYQNGMLGTLPQGSPHSIDFADFTQEYMTFSVSESVVKVNVTGSIASYYTSSYSDVGGIVVVNITKYSSGASSCGYAVTVREALSGVETTFKVTWSDVMLSTITLNAGHIVF